MQPPFPFSLSYQSFSSCNSNEEYKKAVTIHPNLIEVHFNLGIIYGKKGRLDEAIEEYKKTLKIDPDYAMAHNNLSVRYYYKGNYKLAIKHCDKARKLGLKIHPQFLKQLELYR